MGSLHKTTKCWSSSRLYSWSHTFPTFFLPQGSILSPILFNIFMCDMFLILKTTSFTGYADDNTPFVVRENTTNVIKALEDIGENLIKWFSDNQMKINTDKWHVLLNSQERT